MAWKLVNPNITNDPSYLDPRLSDDESKISSNTTSLAEIATDTINLSEYKSMFIDTGSGFDIADALNKAIQDSQPSTGYVWGNPAKTIKLPYAPNYKISKTIVMRAAIHIDLNNSKLTSTISNGSMMFDTIKVNSIAIKNGMLYGNANGHTIIGNSNKTSGNQTTYSLFEDLDIDYGNLGIDVYGYGNVISKTFLKFNTLGLQLQTGGGQLVLDRVKISNNTDGAILKDSTSVIMTNFIMEGNTGNTLQIDNCNTVSLSNGYFEPNTSSSIVKVGKLTTNYVTEIIFDNCFFSGSFGIACIDLDYVKKCKIRSCRTDKNFYGYMQTTNTQNIELENTYFPRQLTHDLGNNLKRGNTSNLLPNGLLNEWNGNVPIGWVATHNGGLTAVTKETTIVRKGKSALRAQIATAGGFRRASYKLPNETLNLIKGRNVTLAAWIYIPNITDFAAPGETGQNAPDLLFNGTNFTTIPADEYNVNIGDSFHFKKGQWNLFTHYAQISSTAAYGDIEIYVYIGNGALTDQTTKYIVLDELMILDGIVNAQTIAHYANTPEIYASPNDILFTGSNIGSVVMTPDGTKKYRLGVDNTGVVTATLVP